jgi:2-hydroxycyclohexanecarboxyl-CoA dehydrogenase
MIPREENKMNRVAVITGGASGMGQAVCRTLARTGHRIAVLDLDGAGARSVADELKGEGFEAMAVEVDVADPQSVAAAMAAVRTELGPVAIIVTSAGIEGYAALTDITLESWNRLIAVNLTGTFLCVQAAVPDMVSSGWGRIVTISSAAGQWGTAQMTHYSASKGGVIAFTKALAREYGPLGITANTIPPGAIDTPMSVRAQETGNLPADEVLANRIPVGRKGTTEEIAATCAFLCTDEAGYITGQAVAVNGGLVI